MIMELIALRNNTSVSSHQLQQSKQKAEAHRKAGGFIVLGPIFFPYCSPKPTEMFGWVARPIFFFFFFLRPEVIGVGGVKK